MTPAKAPPTPDEAFESYRQLVEETDQAPPLLHYCVRGHLLVVQIQFPGTIPNDIVLVGVCTMLREREGTPDWVVLFSECWVTPDPEMQNADLETVRASGSPVGDALLIQCAHQDGDWTIIRPFIRVGGTVVWEPYTDDRSDQHHLIDVLRQVVSP